MKQILIFLISSLLGYSQSVMASNISNDPLLLELDSLSTKNLIYSSNVHENEILSLCMSAEDKARSCKDYNNLFRIGQITVASNCRKGNFGLGINKAQKMYEEAKTHHNQLGIALSIQAIGNTYMYAGQYKQAKEFFDEAEDRMKSLDDNISKIQLTIQQLHTFVGLNDMSSMKDHLNIAQTQLSYIPNNSYYSFYVLYYQILYYIGIKDIEKAAKGIDQLIKNNEVKKTFPRWYYELSFHYYTLTEDYTKALSYCDSTLSTVLETGNINEYKDGLMHKAYILRLMNQPNDACLVYERINELGDSLNVEDYSRQIDSLHITYWIDQMEVDNAKAYNNMLTWILIYAITVLLITILIIWIVRKDSKRLIISRKNLEIKHSEAAQSIHSKSLFLSNMSHELRTPLTAIVGFSDLLTTEMDLDPEMKQQCGELIKQNSDLLLKLLNDVIDISALKGNNMKFTFAKSDAITLCKKVIETVDKVKRTSAQVLFTTNLEKLELYTDPERLQQVLINLLINATKFTPEGTITLNLCIDENKNEAVFAVEDTGCGIPLEKQAHIFERFEKLHNNIQGAGLGLSICQLIIERIGGEIWIDSTYTQGARFVFTHPLDNQSKQKEA